MHDPVRYLRRWCSSCATFVPNTAAPHCRPMIGPTGDLVITPAPPKGPGGAYHADGCDCSACRAWLARRDADDQARREGRAQ